jgi:hypothetical protein
VVKRKDVISESYIFKFFWFDIIRVISHAVKRLFLSADALVQSQGSLCRICHGLNGTGKRFSPSTPVSPTNSP